MTKIAIVGAGSLVFTRTLVRDLLRQRLTADAEIRLVDIDPQRLDQSRRAVEHLVDKAGTRMSLVATTDCATGVRGCNYVVNTIQVGGKEATRVDFDLPERFGVRQTIADTHGIGGISRALRTVPALEIARTVEEHAPDAWFLNYTNPMAMVVMALAGASGVRHVGLCHGTEHTVDAVAAYLGIAADRERFAWQAAGINHMTWLLTLSLDGQDTSTRAFANMPAPRGPEPARRRGAAGADAQVRLLRQRVERPQRRVLPVVPAAGGTVALWRARPGVPFPPGRPRTRTRRGTRQQGCRRPGRRAGRGPWPA